MSNDKQRRRTVVQTLFERPEAILESDGWCVLRLKAGEVLWHNGDRSDSLAVVRSGALSVSVKDTKVGVINEGEIVGEASAFGSGRRMGDVTALRDTELMVLDRAGIMLMRRDEPKAYDALLDQALTEIGRRVELTNHRLVTRSEGLIPAPTQENLSALAKLWQKIVKPKPPEEPFPVEPALLSLPVGGNGKEAPLALIGVTLEPRYVEKGEALIMEGEIDHDLHLVAKGTFQVLKASGDTMAHELAELGMGALIGTGGFLRGVARGASVVAMENSWVWSMTQEDYENLEPIGRRLLDEVLLTTMRDQLMGANLLLAQAKNGGTDTEMEAVLKAFARMESWQSGNIKDTIEL